MIDQAAEAIVSALGRYQPPAPGRGWRPQPHQSSTPWRSRLEAYTFGAGDAATAGKLFTCFCDQLNGANPDYTPTLRKSGKNSLPTAVKAILLHP